MGVSAQVAPRWLSRLLQGPLGCSGFHQHPGVDIGETFSPVIKPSTVRIVLHLITSLSWSVHQVDISNAFLNGILAKRVYCQQPMEFVNRGSLDHVCQLSKSPYGLPRS
jgi:hypothetical protein